MNLIQCSEIVPLAPSLLPHPRSGHRAVATNSDLWIFGGFHPSALDGLPCMFNELWRFNFALQRWTLEQTTGDGPEQTLASHAMSLAGHHVFVFGGTGFPFGQSISNILYILDLKRLHWRQCQLREDRLTEVYGASIVQDDDHLYILCGTNRTMYSMDVYQIHLCTWTCTLISETFNQIDWLDDGRYRQEAHLYNNQIFVFGGGGSFGMTFPLSRILVFDLLTRQWSRINTIPDPVHKYPQARKFHSIFPFRDDQILMFGGAYYDTRTHEHVPVDEYFWTFHCRTLQWSRFSSLKLVRPLYFQAAAMNSNGEIWIHGGVVGDIDEDHHPIRISNIYYVTTQVEKLSEIAWKKFLHHLADRRCLTDRSELLEQLHIPSEFAQRVR